MTETPNAPWRTRIFVRLTLLMIMPLALFVARVLYTDEASHLALPWNLFLAWLPLLFAHLAMCAGSRRPWLSVLLSGAWLAFLPNAPYLITDLIWLDGPASPLKVYDAVLFFAFATCGLAVGFVSLRWMQMLIAQKTGSWGSRVFVLATLGLVGFGLYLGRFRRWNSWDIVTDPVALLRDIAVRLADPVQHWRTWALTVLFTGLLLSLYILLGLVTEVAAGEPRTTKWMV